MSFLNEAKYYAGGVFDAAKSAGSSAYSAAKGTDYMGLGRNAGSLGAKSWKMGNNASNGFLNPTAIGMGIGGAIGGYSDNGSVAGGALIGGMGGAGYAMGRGYFKVGSMTNRAPAFDYGPPKP